MHSQVHANAPRVAVESIFAGAMLLVLLLVAMVPALSLVLVR